MFSCFYTLLGIDDGLYECSVHIFLGTLINLSDHSLNMDPFMISCILLVVGALFIIYEVFSPGGFLVIPGIVLLILGIVGLVWPDVLMSIWAPIIALAVAIPVTLVTLKFYQHLAKPEPPTTTVAESLVGRDGIVTVATESGNMKGKVKIGGDLWSATSDEPIEEGTEVTVESSEGVHVHVRRK